MLIETLIGVTLCSLVLACVAQAHRELASLSSSAHEREERELQTLREHLYPQLDDAAFCHKFQQEDLIFKDCDLQTTTVRTIENGGFFLFELLVALFILSVVIALSFPALHQLLVSRSTHEISRQLDRNIQAAFSKLENDALSANLLPIGETVRMIPKTDPLQKFINSLNSTRKPRSGSPTILFIAPFASAPLRVKRFNLWNQSLSLHTLFICGEISDETDLFLGVTPNRWMILKEIARKKGEPECSGSHTTNLLLEDFPEPEAEQREPPPVLFPVQFAYIVFVDQENTLRRYDLLNRRSDPLLYHVELFAVNDLKNVLKIKLRLKEHEITREGELNLSLIPKPQNGLLQIAL